MALSQYLLEHGYEETFLDTGAFLESLGAHRPYRTPGPLRFVDCYPVLALTAVSNMATMFSGGVPA